MAQREHKAHRHGTLAFLHQFARHVVDGRNVIGIHRVTQPKAICKKRRSQQHGKMPEHNDRPDPRPGIHCQQQSVDTGNFAPSIAHRVVQKIGEQAR